MSEIPEVETMTPAEAGKILHANAETVRAGLKSGRFPFRCSNTTNKKREMELHNY